MHYVIGDAQKELIKEAASKTLEVEMCGVVAWTLERGIYVEVLENVADNPKTDFEITDADLAVFGKGDESDPWLAAIWHTHPLESQPARLSPEDIAHSKASGIPYVLYHPIFGEWDYFNPHGAHPHPWSPRNMEDPKTLQHYLGWRFEWNRCDCYTLVRWYYSGMLGIAILDYPRGGVGADCVADPSWNQLLDNFEHAGFRKLHRDEAPQNGDIAIVTLPITGVINPHHCVILHDVSTNTGLHLIDNQISSTVFYGPALQSRTAFVVRHRDMEKSA